MVRILPPQHNFRLKTPCFYNADMMERRPVRNIHHTVYGVRMLRRRGAPQMLLQELISPLAIDRVWANKPFDLGFVADL